MVAWTRAEMVEEVRRGEGVDVFFFFFKYDVYF